MENKLSVLYYPFIVILIVILGFGFDKVSNYFTGDNVQVVYDSNIADGKKIDEVTTSKTTITYTFTLKGDNEERIYVGSSWSDPGYTVIGSDGKDYSSFVTVNGKVKTKVAGEYPITYTFKHGNTTKKLTRTIYVVKKEIALKSISCNKKEYTVHVGDSITVKPVYNPTNTTSKGVKYNIDNTDVATIDNSGRIEGKTSGTTIITLTSKTDGSIVATCKVTVKAPVTYTFTLKGDSDIRVVNGSTWTDPGYTITASDGMNYKNYVTIKGKVNTKVNGDYKLTYTFKYGSITKNITRTVHVVKKVISLTSVSCNKNEYTIYVGDSVSISPVYNPTNTTQKGVTYSSSNTSVATIDSNGKVVGSNAGTTTITLTSSANSSKKGTCKVTVKNKVVTYSFKLKGESDVRITTGSAWNDPGYTVTGSDGKDYSSYVTKSGTVNTKTIGDYKISYTFKYGTTTKTLIRTVHVVTNTVALKSLSCAKSEYTIYVGDSVAVSPVYNPTNTTQKGVTYSSNSTGVATIDSNGKVVGKAVGTATITITSSVNSSIKATCKVNVKTKPVNLTSLSCAKGEYTIYVGDNTTVSPVYNPTNTTQKGVSFTSSSTGVATIDSSGKVVGKSAGSTTITLTSTANSSIKGTCKVTVKTKTVAKTEEKIHFINVKNGDAILIESNGKYGLIDAANPSNYNDSYFNVSTGSGTTVLNYLKSVGVTHLEFIIGSHAHSDHVGGIPELVYNSSLVNSNTTFIYKSVSRDSSPYGEIVINAVNQFANTDRDWKSTEFLSSAKTAVASKGGVLLDTTTHSNMSKLGASYVADSDRWKDYITFKMGDLTFKIYNLYQYSQTSGGKTYIDHNSNSLVTIVTSSNGKKAWLSGDLNVRSSYEKYYADIIGSVDILKSNHHGGLYSNSYYFLRKLNPKHFVITSDGSYGAAAGACVYTYGGTAHYSGIQGNSAYVITMGSTITESGNGVEISAKNVWLQMNYNDAALYWVYVGSDKKLVRNDWVSSKGYWYYMDSEGFMMTNQWVKDDGKWYYLGSDGKMYANTTKTIGGVSYHFNASGACDSAGC